jgi:hypothetical protein
MRGFEVWSTFKAAQKSTNVYNSSWRNLKSGENKSGLLRQIREWPVEEKQKNVKRVHTRASSKKFNNDEEKASWIATEMEDANNKIEPFNAKWFPSGWLAFAYLGYPSGLKRQDFTCFNPPQREEVQSQMKKVYEDLGLTGTLSLSLCHFLSGTLSLTLSRFLFHCTSLNMCLSTQEIKLREGNLEMHLQCQHR